MTLAASRGLAEKWPGEKASAGGRKTFRRSKKSHFRQVLMLVSPTKKIWIKNLAATRRTTILKISTVLADFRWKTLGGDFSPFFTKNAKKRSFFEVLTDFWFKSFLLDRKYLCSLWKYMISRHYSSLLVLTYRFSRHFRHFWGPENAENDEKRAVRTSNDE